MRVLFLLTMWSWQGRQHLVASGTFTGWMLLDKEAQRLSWSNFQQETICLVQQLANTIGKPDCLAHMLRPISRVSSLLLGNPCPGNVREVRNTWCMQLDTLSKFCDFFRQRIQHVRMKGMRC